MEQGKKDFNLSNKLPSVWKRGQLLGQGRFGEVFLLIDQANPYDELFVIKDMHLPKSKKSKEKSLIAFRRETQILMILEEHIRIVPFYGSLLTETDASIFLGYMRYGSLSQYCHYQGPMPEERCINFMKQILDGLKYLHERRIIHRDIKGSNVLLENEFYLRLSDFGISKCLNEASNTKTTDVGTWRWMAPEICNPEISQGKYNFKADICVGCTVVEMLTGKVPYAEIEHEPSIIFQVGHGVPPTVPKTKCNMLTHLLNEMVFLKKPCERISAAKLLIKLEHISSSQREKGKESRTFNFHVSCLEVKRLITKFPILIPVLIIVMVYLILLCTRGFEIYFSATMVVLVFLLLCLFNSLKRRTKDAGKFPKYGRQLKPLYWEVHGETDIYINEHDLNVSPLCKANCHDCILSLLDFKIHYNATFKHDHFYGKQLFDFILSVADLTVLVNVRTVHFQRYKHFHEEHVSYDFSFMKNGGINGTGVVYRMFIFSNVDKHWKYQSCPCRKCKNQFATRIDWAEIHVMTAAYFIQDDVKDGLTTCTFYFDSLFDVGVSVEVIDIEELDVQNNWCILKCVTCDLSLVRRLHVAMETFDELRLRVCETYQHLRDVSRVAFIVSHPFGTQKHVSLGHWNDITMVGKVWSQYTYSINTFPGCAGAYVHIIGYNGEVWHYPHLHRCRSQSGSGFHVK